MPTKAALSERSTQILINNIISRALLTSLFQFLFVIHHLVISFFCHIFKKSLINSFLGETTLEELTMLIFGCLNLHLGDTFFTLNTAQSYHLLS